MRGHKDYSETPLSQKLGAKPGAGVVVLFTTSQADLERRFAALRDSLDPADGLWIAWPKKAAAIETDLDFAAVQRDRARGGTRRQQELRDRRALAGGAVRLAARGPARRRIGEVKIRAAVLEDFGAPLVVQEVELAEPRAGEVLVRLVACGVCHTDLYTASGADPSGYAPTVLGHEGAGVVERVGEGVTSVA